MNRRRVSDAPRSITVPAGAPAWVTPELLAHTLRVWQPHYRELLTEWEALDMLLNAAQLVRLLADDSRAR